MECEYCKGKGYTMADDWDSGHHLWFRVRCDECGGKGTVKLDPYIGYCPSCWEIHTLSQCQQREIDETCVYVCRTNGAIIEPMAR